MKFSFNKVLAAIGSNRALEKTIDKNYTKNIIAEIEQTPFAISKSNVLYAGLNELTGYYYFQTVTIGSFKTKTFKGAKLKLIGDDFELELKSDMNELKSEIGKTLEQNVTNIDFEIDEKDISKIKKSTIKSIILLSNKKQEEFSIYQD